MPASVRLIPPKRERERLARVSNMKAALNMVYNPSLSPMVEAEFCKESFYHFIHTFWEVIVKEPPIWNWHIAYLAELAQNMVERVAESKPKEHDLIVNVSPGSTKSTIFVQMLPAWAWTRWPWMRFIAGSYSGDLATEHGGLCRDIIISEKYKMMFPKIKIRSDQDAKSNFKLTEGGQRSAVSVGGTVTGKHAHVILVDDPLNPKEAVSEAHTRTANQWMDQTLSTRKIDKAITPTILVMQRLHEDDCTGNWIKKKDKKVFHICLPGECKNYEVKPSRMKRFYKDGLFDPARMSWEVLQDMKLDLGEYGFAGQIGQDPSPPEGGLFKVQALRSHIVQTPPVAVRRIVRYWDKAGTHKGGAYTAGVKIGLMRNNTYIILDVVRGQWGPDVREEIIYKTAEHDGYGVSIYMEQEPGSGGKDSITYSIRNLAGFKVHADRPTGDKIYRADPFAAQCNAGNVYLLSDDWNSSFIEELRLFPNGRYKDQVDAASGAFSKLVLSTKRAGAW